MFGSHDRLSFSIQAVTHLITPLASTALTLVLTFLWRVMTVNWVVCAITTGCTAPIVIPSATWSSIGAAGLWFPVLLLLSESLSIQAHFTDGVLAFGVIVAFLMWIRGMIAAGGAVISMMEQQPCPSQRK